MPMLPFLGATLVGATLWNTFLLICGMKLRDHWHVVQKYSHQVDVVVLFVLAVGVVWFYRTKRRQQAQSKG
jgi:membrane protein DedA with SNARE-associated domain